MRIVSLFIISLISANIIAQKDQTMNEKTRTAARESAASHKALIIPFEPRLYMGEVDHQINAETNLSSRQIKNKFRDGLNEQLYKAFKMSKFNALDFMEDTVKYQKEMEKVYQYLAYDYVKVPDQKNYKVPQKQKEEKKIEKGQLNVETNSEARFMNARLTNSQILPSLNGKYKTDVVVFINQLDIKASGSKDPIDLGMGNPNRKITVHYTVFTSDGKEINSGIVDEEFDPLLNNPKKIIDKHFSKVAATIVARVNKALMPAVK